MDRKCWDDQKRNGIKEVRISQQWERNKTFFEASGLNFENYLSRELDAEH